MKSSETCSGNPYENTENDGLDDKYTRKQTILKRKCKSTCLRPLFCDVILNSFFRGKHRFSMQFSRVRRPIIKNI